MSLTIQISTRRDFKNSELNEMHRLRAKIFGERKGWEVQIDKGMEIDGFDAVNPHYMMMREPGGVLRGCWRLLTTEGPYMLKNTFPQLLHGSLPPRDPKIWELSRFAIETRAQSTFGFSEIAIRSIGQILIYGRQAGIEQYVTVTTTAVERMLLKAGVSIKRIGPPMMIGIEKAVAIYVNIRESVNSMKSLYAIRNLLSFGEYVPAD